ncbi:transposase [Pseudomonas sp. Leaf127]|uniref:transposase n=1 Tax=Pseudomonas sp. Leaf127 TaxID=1736267 RepID=UPI001F3FECB8|nr:transposase [Pseudomonas sp. Leaf127]
MSLCKDNVYYLLNNDPYTNRVRLVDFYRQEKEIKVTLLTMSRFEFEDALENGWVEELKKYVAFPPWLEPVKGITIAHLESRRTSSKESYDHKVNRRFMAISELVIRSSEILTSDNPNAIINAHAKALNPPQNAARLRLWFYTYIVFGRNKWALMPPLHRIGGWNREYLSPAKKLGRPSRKGKKHGYPITAEIKESVLSGFLKYKSSSKNRADIYGEVLTNEFGCTTLVKEGVRGFIHLQGRPFPTQRQFYYWIEKLINPKALSIALKGSHQTRKNSGSKGSFAERIINIYQSVEFDGYNISSRLTGLIEKSSVDAFCVVRAVCGLSGAVLGIGFSHGKENMNAYKMALFSMGMDKVKYCELYGLTIDPDEWPCQGLAGNIVFDRGPSAYYDCEPEINWLGSFELTPVFSGQSKASVESSHPRDKKVLGPPTYVQSRLNFVDMAKREILQAVKDNLNSDASGRMDEELILNGVKPTPNGIFNYFSSRCRDSSINILFEELVSSFLVKHPATIHKDAVHLYGRKYRSAELVGTGVFDRVARKGAIPTSVYVLTMCVRHIWIEIEGELLELDSVRSVRTTDGTVDISLQELQEINALRRTAKTELSYEKPAIDQEFRERYKLATGQNWDGGIEKIGRSSKGEAYKLDTSDYHRFSGNKK